MVWKLEVLVERPEDEHVVVGGLRPGQPVERAQPTARAHNRRGRADESRLWSQWYRITNYDGS